MGIVYASREDVKAAMDMAETARADAQVDRLLDAASRSIDALCHRRFYPELATRTFSWPNDQMHRSWRLWLDANELLSVTTLTSGGVEIADYFLEPQASGPPYSRIEIDLSGADAFGGGPTHQRDITIVGEFGACNDEAPAGTLTAGPTAGATTIDVSDASAVGVGDLIKVGTERMQVTARRVLDTGQAITAALGEQRNAVTVAVTDGAAYTVGETLLIDAERMAIVDIATNNLIVRRAVDGSVLAAHDLGAEVYAARRLTVARGVLGTTAATHGSGDAITRHAPPALVRQLAIAETLNALQQEGSAYARTIGSGDSERNASVSALRLLRESVYSAYGRKTRARAV